MNQEYGQPSPSEGQQQQQRPAYNNNNNQGQGQGQGGDKPAFTGPFPTYHNIITESKMRLAGEKDPNVQYINGRPPSLTLGREDTNPRFNVYPNIEGMKTDPIIVRMDPIILEIVLDIIVEAARAEPGFRKQVVTKNYDQENKRIYDEAKTTIGKHRDNGVVYIRIQSMTDTDIPELNFTFAARSFLSVIQGDGVPMNPSDFSSAYAESWANKVRRLYDFSIATLTKKRRQGQGNWQGNRQGGNNNWQNRQGGGNYQNKQGGGNNNYQNQNQGNSAPAEPRKPTYTTDYPSLSDDDSL